MNDILLKLSKNLKSARQKHNLSLQQVAELSDVSTGLVSKIENFRTLPSLPVLFRIMRVLKIDLSELSAELTISQKLRYILVKKNNNILEQREDSEGLTYNFLFSDNLPKSGMRVYIVTVKKGIYREHISTDGLEFIYVLNGNVHYFLKGEKIILSQGDTLFFNGSIAHTVRNITEQDTTLLRLYFTSSKS